MIKQKDQTALIIFALALVGTVGIMFGTRWGIGVSHDSVDYISAARNLLDGRGLTLYTGSSTTVPMTHYPPLYPLSLAAIAFLTGIDPLSAARRFHIVLFGINLLVIMFIINKYSGKYFAFIGVLLMLTSFTVLELHLSALTEPLFIFWSLLGLYWFGKYLENSTQLFSITAAIAIGLAFATRYTGVTLVVTGLAGLLFLGNSSNYRKLLDSLLFGTISCLPIALWLIRNLRVASTATNREFVFHSINVGQFRQALSTFSTWIIPFNILEENIIREITAFALLVGLLVFSLLLLKQQGVTFQIYITKIPYFIKLLVIFILVYTSFLIVSILFFDANTPLDGRILSPVYVSGIILTLYLVSQLWPFLKSKPTSRTIAKILGLIFITLNLFYGGMLIIIGYKYGLGYTSLTWKHSETIKQIEALPAKTTIYSNGPDAIYILTNRPASLIPTKIKATTRQANPDYLFELTALADQLHQTKGVIVYFDTIPWRWYLPTKQQLENDLPPHISVNTADGTIYQIVLPVNTK